MVNGVTNLLDMYIEWLEDYKEEEKKHYEIANAIKSEDFDSYLDYVNERHSALIPYTFYSNKVSTYESIIKDLKEVLEEY